VPVQHRPCLACLGVADQDVEIQSNNAQAASDVSLVSVGGNLNGEGNSPTVTHSHGPSWVDGRSQGQWAAFSTTKFPVADPALSWRQPCCRPAALDCVADSVIDNLPACRAKFDPATATYTSGGRNLPLAMHRTKKCDLFVAGTNSGINNINQGPGTSKGRKLAPPAGAVVEDHVTNIAQGYAWDGGWMTTAGIPVRKIGSPGKLPGDFTLGVGGDAFLSPAQPAFNSLSFNVDTDLGMLSPNTLLVAYSTSANQTLSIMGTGSSGFMASAILPSCSRHNQVLRRDGAEVWRPVLALLPDPEHGSCSDGPATDQFDLLTPLANWVENGTPPGPINATGVNFTPATYQVSLRVRTGHPGRGRCARILSRRALPGTYRSSAVRPLQATRRIWLIRQNINASHRLISGNGGIPSNGRRNSNSRRAGAVRGESPLRLGAGPRCTISYARYLAFDERSRLEVEQRPDATGGSMGSIAQPCSPPATSVLH
jgi:hypothetical protein